MPKLKKANRIVEVSESRKGGYLRRGYDEIDDNGKVKTRATGGKTISVAEYNKLEDQVAEYELKIKQLEQQEGESEELKELREENKEYEQEIERLSEENKKLKQQLSKQRKNN